ncbi:MAG: hypothetical protein OEX23_03370 [Betaproteobacteria bacterium]|nr:hypothetical protein [Betaproteobacteria bacterium]
MRRHALLLLACPRSGATALAAGLAHAGAYAGRTFLAAPAGEPSATWQSAALAAFNERLLASMGMRWDALVPLPDRWRERPGVRALAAEADALIAEEWGGADHVVLHESHLALTASFWRERFEAAGFDVGCAIVVRRPAEVAASMARREPFAPEKSLALWLHYLAEAERGSRGGSRTLITYDRLLDAPAGALSHVVADTRFGLRIERAEREAALTAIRPELRRYGDEHGTAIAGLSSGIDAALEEGYRQLAKLAPGADPRRAVEAIAQAAQVPMLHAIPPWLAQELANARAQAERQSESLREAAQRSAALEASLAEARRANIERDRREAELRRRIDEMARPRHPEGLDARVDEALAQLRSDVARMATSLTDQPEREHRMLLENAQLQRDLADERNTIAKLSEAYEREKAAAEQFGADLAAAQANLHALADELERARASEQAWNQHGEELARDVDAARDALHAMQSERDALRKERDQAAQQLEKMREELDTARTDLRIVDNDRTALTARAQAVTDAAAALREELARRSANEAALAAERDRLAAELKESTGRAAALEKELSRRMADLSALSGRNESLGRVLAEVEKSWMGRRAIAGLRRNNS